MLATLKRLALTALGALGILTATAMVKTSRAKASPDAKKLLQHLATHTSAPVPELSSVLKLPADETQRLLTELEARGAVQLSADQGSTHVRIAAITKVGREEIA